MEFDLSHVLSVTYLFDLNPGPLLLFYFKFFLIFFSVMLFLGIGLKRYGQKLKGNPRRQLLGKISRMCVWLGFLGLVWIFFRQQSIVFFAAPFWLIVWLLGLITWLTLIVRYYLHGYQKLLMASARQSEQQKYLRR
jgi:amino acid transporter